MTIAECLDADAIRLSAEGGSLEEVLHLLMDAMLDPAVDPATRAKRARDLAFGSQGDVVRLDDEVVLVLDVQEGLTEPRAGFARTVGSFTVTAEGREEPDSARAVFLFLLPGRLSTFRGHAAPALSRWVREDDHAERLLRAGSAHEVLALPGLGDIAVTDRARVDVAMSPVTYRVYPDTPAVEVLDLMVRRGLSAVPVVGEGYEVMGIITAGDALRHLLPRWRATDGGEGPLEVGGSTARDIMTRSVLCVAEDQPLADAAAMMVNRDVDELPVVREGELVGVLTREAVLRVLYES